MRSVFITIHYWLQKNNSNVHIADICKMWYDLSNKIEKQNFMGYKNVTKSILGDIT